jgi:hypothetical protein
MTQLLIDGDVLCYRAGFATDKTKYLVTYESDPNVSDETFDDAKAAKDAAAKHDDARIWSRREAEPEDKALMLVSVMLKDIEDHYAAENPTTSIYLSGPTNFRDRIATRARYKGSRSGVVPPVHLKAIRNHLVSNYGAIVTDQEEADDAIARRALEGGAIICSLDKDLRSVPGRFYNFVTKQEETISVKDAALNFFAQVLSGDPVDSVPGLPGVGPVRARKALSGCRSTVDAWQTCLNLYTAEFGPELGPQYALECARLVKVGMPKGVLWEPPKINHSSSDSGTTLKNVKAVVGSGKEPGKGLVTA